jgi:chondroitin AC lyase
MFPTIKALIPALVAISLAFSNHARANDFKIIKERVVTELMKTPINDQSVEAILGRMAADGSFSDINYEDLSRTAGFPHRRHTGDLVYLEEEELAATSGNHRRDAYQIGYLPIRILPGG